MQDGYLPRGLPWLSGHRTQNSKFVPAEARCGQNERVLFKTIGDRPQDFITEGMAKLIVQRLEAVKIYESDEVVGARGGVLLDHIQERPPVTQPREGVFRGETRCFRNKRTQDFARFNALECACHKVSNKGKKGRTADNLLSFPPVGDRKQPSRS